MKRRIIILSLIISLFIISHAATLQETLNQYISDLQKNPNDNALREKIIRHVQTMKPKPAIPEDAKKYMVRGKAAFKGAKEANDFNDAASEFQKALLAAPWLAEGYYNLGIVQDKAGQYAAAMESLKLYIIAVPNATDVEKVKELIYEVEYRKDKATKESSPAAKSEKKQNEYDAWLKKLDGARYIAVWETQHSRSNLIIDIKGNKATQGSIFTWASSENQADPETRVSIGVFYPETVPFEGKLREYTITGRQFFFELTNGTVTWTISDDGNTITQSSQNKINFTYYRQK